MYQVIDITTRHVVYVDQDPILALRQVQKDLAKADERFQELEAEAATLELELAVEKIEAKKLQESLDTNIKERDILATEKAELRQKLADSEELREDFQEDFVRAKAELQKFREQDRRWRDMTDNLKLQIQKLEAENATLKDQNTGVRITLSGDLCGSTIVNLAEYKQLQEENASLKLEVEKLKGLIVEARKYVATANLMLA